VRGGRVRQAAAQVAAQFTRPAAAVQQPDPAWAVAAMGICRSGFSRDLESARANDFDPG